VVRPDVDGSAPAPVADNGVNISGRQTSLVGHASGHETRHGVEFHAFKDQIALNLQNSIYARPAFLNATGNGQDAWMNLSYSGFADQLAQGLDLTLHSPTSTPRTQTYLLLEPPAERC